MIVGLFPIVLEQDSGIVALLFQHMFSYLLVAQDDRIGRCTEARGDFGEEGESFAREPAAVLAAVCTPQLGRVRAVRAGMDDGEVLGSTACRDRWCDRGERSAAARRGVRRGLCRSSAHPFEQPHIHTPRDCYDRVGMVPAKEQQIVVAEPAFQSSKSSAICPTLYLSDQWCFFVAKGIDIDVVSASTKSRRAAERIPL